MCAPGRKEGAGVAAAPPTAYPAQAGVAAGAYPETSSTSTPVDPALEAERDRALTCLTAFERFNPPIFNEESKDPWEMVSWVDTIEKLFENLYTLEQDKVHLAVHCLEKSARVWWKATHSDKKKMEEQFQSLKQGTHTVREYEKEFSHIVNCVPHVVRSDEDKAGCFERGLRQSKELLKCVRSVNREMKVRRRNGRLAAPMGHRNSRSPRSIHGDSGGIEDLPAVPFVVGIISPRNVISVGDVSNVGKQGHRWPQGSRAVSSSRVFAAQVEEPTVADDVVAGIVLINGTRTRALFDTGASNLFISMSFAKAHGIEISENADAWWVYAPEHTFSVKKECAACPVQIGDWIMPVGLLVLSRMKGFDIVLGIDWLSKYYATIDCKSRVITFREPGQKEVVYRACKSSRFAMTVSISKVRRLIKSGCVAYLASVVETQRELLALGIFR
uniref:Retrotransposon gag domain-containing protein n=1 Tax=Ananas comosus var. bracteatus TaxID=296719 RepID=A0A6V7NFT5_ANACO|nr:unnamed protein product [Ananas comosus var. bracteatus]